jgi:hypothetical protein
MLRCWDDNCDGRGECQAYLILKRTIVPGSTGRTGPIFYPRLCAYHRPCVRRNGRAGGGEIPPGAVPRGVPARDG